MLRGRTGCSDERFFRYVCCVEFRCSGAFLAWEQRCYSLLSISQLGKGGIIVRGQTLVGSSPDETIPLVQLCDSASRIISWLGKGVQSPSSDMCLLRTPAEFFRNQSMSIQSS